MAFVRRFGTLLVALAAVAAVWTASAVAAPPVNVTAPSISGFATDGWRLVADPGTWSGATSDPTYQWRQCDTASPPVCIDIPGATGKVYTPTSAQIGDTVEVVVTESNAGGQTPVTTGRVGPIVAGYRVTTDHFAVHYVGGGVSGGITETQAGDVGALAERAYAAERADGYPAPRSDGTLGSEPGEGSLIDIYVYGIGGAGLLGYAAPDSDASVTSGSIYLDGDDPEDALDQHTIAHELFHLIQFGIWIPSDSGDDWLLEGSAEWMGYRVDGYDYGPGASSYELGDWDMPLDCRDPLFTSQCDLTGEYKNDGYSRWPFFEYLAERWGNDFVQNVFEEGAAHGGPAASALAAAIGAKGGSIGDTFNDWAVANMTGAYSVKQLQTVPVPTYGSPISTGTLASLNVATKQGAPRVTSGAIPSVKVAVDHLSARYVAIERGSADYPDAPCYAATLELSVALPHGIGARPYFWWSAQTKDGKKQPAQALSVDGDTATITLPWDTCDWGDTKGYLMLANSNQNLDAQDFTVTGTLSVDASSETTATPPPDPVSMPGTTIDAPSSDVAPRIQVFGPELIRLPSTARQLRLIVSSSSGGRLQAVLGSHVLGRAKLRAGGNDVRFKLPSSALVTLRRTSSAASNVLALTPLSTSGQPGKRVVRHVAIERPAGKKPPARR